MVDMICKRAHSSIVYGNPSVGDPYTLSSELKADYHEMIGIGERAEPKAQPAPAPKKPAKKSGEAAMAAITGQKK